MKRIEIEGTIDLIGEMSRTTSGASYDYLSFLTRDGNEVLINHVSVEPDMEKQIKLGATGRFVVLKGLFSTTLASTSRYVAA